MTALLTAPAPTAEPEPYRFSVDQYHAMIAAGIHPEGGASQPLPGEVGATKSKKPPPPPPLIFCPGGGSPPRPPAPVPPPAPGAARSGEQRAGPGPAGLPGGRDLGRGPAPRPRRCPARDGGRRLVAPRRPHVPESL